MSKYADELGVLVWCSSSIRCASETEKSSTWQRDWDTATLIWWWLRLSTFLDFQTQADQGGGGEGGHYPWWHSYGWQTQIGASGSHYSVLLMGLPLLLYHKSTNCPFSVSTVCHHLSRFFVSIKELDGLSLHKEDIFAIYGDLSLDKYSNQISETPTPKFQSFLVAD